MGFFSDRLTARRQDIRTAASSFILHCSEHFDEAKYYYLKMLNIAFILKQTFILLYSV